MANKSHRAVMHYISNRISEQEKALGLTLPGPDRELLTELSLETLDRTIDKYIAGSAKHGGNLLTRSCITELHNELIDALVYHAAMRKQFSAFMDTRI